MRYSQRDLSVLLIMMLFVTLTLIPTAAQDDITVSGSGIAIPVFEAVITENSELDFTVNITGTTNGISAFCRGESEVLVTNRPISLDEEANCTANETEFAELLLAYNALVFIANPDVENVDCITDSDFNDLLPPSGIQYATWTDFFGADAAPTGDESERDEEDESVEDAQPINIYLPAPNTHTYALLDNTITGVGFRTDANTLNTDADIITSVAEEAGAFGVISLTSLPDNPEVTVVELRNPDLGRCVEPSVDTVADASYIAGTPLLVYVNAAVLEENSVLAEALQVLAGEAISTTVTDAGFTPAAEIDRLDNEEVLLNGERGRQFSSELTDFQIPASVSGEINIGGAAGAYSLINANVTSFTNQFSTVTINQNFDGESSGLRRLCNDEIDLTATYTPLSEETIENCNAVDIDLVDLEIGSQVVVLVANEAADHLTCLTTEQITTTWQASSADSVTTWQDVDEGFPEDEFVLFAGDVGNPIANLMIQQAAGESLPLRADAETNGDPLYRAAATANVETALTYMSWSQYQDVLANEQERIQLVAVNGGEGCITPDMSTISSGEYPLSRSLHLIINQAALERIDVQSFLWFMFGEDRFGTFERQNIDTLTLRDLADIRDRLQDEYDRAAEIAAERTAAEAAAAEESAEDTSTDDESSETTEDSED